MNELQTQMEQAIAALWESAHHITPEPAIQERSQLLAVLRRAKTQLAGLELHLLEEARSAAPTR